MWNKQWKQQMATTHGGYMMADRKAVNQMRRSAGPVGLRETRISISVRLQKTGAERQTNCPILTAETSRALGGEPDLPCNGEM